MNVLYLGMATDIMTPLILSPDLQNLFVIDLLDITFAYCNTFDERQQEIKQILVDGSDVNSKRRRHCLKCYNEENNTELHHLDDRASILHEEKKDNYWELRFMYAGKERRLIVWYRNFLHMWPEEIRNVNIIIGIGSVTQNAYHNRIFMSMIIERTAETFEYWVSGHHHFPDHFVIKNGGRRDGYEIQRISLNSKDKIAVLSKLLSPDSKTEN